MNSRALALPSTAPAKLSITLLSGREGNLSDPTPEVLELLENLRQGAKPQSPLDSSPLRLAGLDLSALDLSDCCLEGVRAEGTGFGMTTMQRVRLFGAEMDHATSSKSDLSDSDLRCAQLRQARLHEANLTRVDVSQADLTGANLEGADVKGADFNDAILCAARLPGLIHYESANWIGVDIRDIHFTGAYLMRRFVLDQNFLEEFRTRGRIASLAYCLR